MQYIRNRIKGKIAGGSVDFGVVVSVGIKGIYFSEVQNCVHFRI